MTNFQEKLHNIISLYQDGFNLLTVSDEIEKMVDEHTSTVQKEAYEKGFRDGKSSIAFVETYLVPAFRGLCAILFFCWVITCAQSCIKDKQKQRESDQKEITATLKACSDGDYTTCRQGWLKFKDQSDLYYSNPTCQSFEEAYFKVRREDSPSPCGWGGIEVNMVSHKIYTKYF